MFPGRDSMVIVPPWRSTIRQDYNRWSLFNYWITGGRCLTTGLRRGAVNVGIHAQVVERAGQDRHRGCTGLTSVAGGRVIIAALPGGEAADNQPDDKKHRSEVHVASLSMMCDKTQRGDQ